MNLALPAFLILLFVLPGFIFNLNFYQLEGTPLNYTLTHKTVVGLFITIILHVIWSLFSYSFGFEINYQKFFVLVSGVHSEIYTTTITSIQADSLAIAAVYFISMYIFAYSLGLLMRRTIEKFQLDKSFSSLRVASPWYYLFKGYDWEEGKPDSVQIVATVDLAGQEYLYVGYLDAFFLDREGSIDRLILTGAMRRNIENNKYSSEEDNFEKRFYPIDGHYFVLKYAEIKNLTVQFVKLEPE